MSLREAIALIVVVVILQAWMAIIIHFLSPTTPIDFGALAWAIFIMAGVAGCIAAILVVVFKRYAGERAVRLALMTLTDDERKVFEAIVRNGGEARQDKLRRELDMSKAKLSALVNNLERKRAITKERYWKTNILRVSKEFRG